jgi:hypothetical protein
MARTNLRLKASLDDALSIAREASITSWDLELDNELHVSSNRAYMITGNGREVEPHGAEDTFNGEGKRARGKLVRCSTWLSLALVICDENP